MTRFEERLWSLIRNFVELGHNNPAMLVAAVRIVEIQEMVDKQLELSGRGSVNCCFCTQQPQFALTVCAEFSHSSFCLSSLRLD